MKTLIKEFYVHRAPVIWRPISDKFIFSVFLTIFFLFATEIRAANKTYQSPKEFLLSVFEGDLPKAKVLWLDADLRRVLKKVTGSRYPGVRIRFWKRSKRTAWILEEIGKYEPITVGVAVDDRRIERLKVLIYRESHGWEVRHEFFTNQFKNLSLNSDYSISKTIDGISGATLSVNALKSVARVALLLHDRAVEIE